MPPPVRRALPFSVRWAGMGHPSTAHFRTFHSLRVKGCADVDTVAAMTTPPDTEIRVHLDDGVDRLVDLHASTHPTVMEMAVVLDRFDPYGSRLAGVLDGIVGGESNMFTGVMCGSYHDVWMELPEDLILTQRIDRTAEGSF